MKTNYVFEVIKDANRDLWHVFRREYYGHWSYGHPIAQYRSPVAANHAAAALRWAEVMDRTSEESS